MKEIEGLILKSWVISNLCELYFNRVETGFKNTIHCLYHLAIRDIVNLVIIIGIKINTSYRDPGHVYSNNSIGG